MSWIKDMIKNWLEIDPSGTSVSAVIQEPYGFEASVFKNQLWYRGDASELHQFYTQTDDSMNNNSFWAASSTTGINFRKIHSGLPSLIVDVLTDIVVSDLTGITIDSTEATKRWEEISEDNHFKDILKGAIKEALISCDGAFKISYDADVSKYPIIEFYSGNRVQYKYKRGRLDAICFMTKKMHKNSAYMLEEEYSKSGVDYTLYKSDGVEIPLESLPELADLQPIINTDDFLMGVQLMFDKSAKWEGRGRSIFDSKSGAFDALDECVSQWVDSMRDGRSTRYIPDVLIPKDPSSGRILKPNSFDNRYVTTGSDQSEGSKNEIDVVHGDIPNESLLASYITWLDLCLQGLISPSTLGIDVKKLDNADAQREKEKMTLYTRNKVVDKLEEVIPQLVEIVLKTDDKLNNRTAGEYKVSISFGEYANPSFEAQVETLSKARVGGIMSIERVVKELYGDSLTEKEKDEEVQRLKDEQGVATVSPPGGGELGNGKDENSLNQRQGLPNVGEDVEILPETGEGQPPQLQPVRAGVQGQGGNDEGNLPK